VSNCWNRLAGENSLNLRIGKLARVCTTPWVFSAASWPCRGAEGGVQHPDVYAAMSCTPGLVRCGRGIDRDLCRGVGTDWARSATGCVRSSPDTSYCPLVSLAVSRFEHQIPSATRAWVPPCLDGVDEFVSGLRLESGHGDHLARGQLRPARTGQAPLQLPHCGALTGQGCMPSAIETRKTKDGNRAVDFAAVADLPGA